MDNGYVNPHQTSEFKKSDEQENTTYHYANSDFNKQAGGYSSENEHKKYTWDASQYTHQSAAEPKKNHTLAIFAVLVSVFLVATLVVLGLFVAYNSGVFELPQTEQIINPDTNLVIKDKPLADEVLDQNGKLTSVGIAKKVTPSVVGIVCYQANQGFSSTSNGSGIIMTEDGFIITNAHVVQNAEAVKVVLEDESEYEAKIVGFDERTDIAVIKIDAKGLSFAEFGDSDKLQAGETVIAIGNPTGVLTGSVTRGIISALNRSVSQDSAYATSFIQTDAAINPGNSGGALVDEYGLVIGINTAKIAQTDVEGIGFAIPINEAKPIIESIVRYGYVKDRVRLGITYYSIDQINARLNSIPAGLYVMSIDSSVDAYGKIKQYDIITKIDGKTVITATDITSILSGKKPGDEVVLTVYRESRGSADTFDVKVILSEDKGTSAATNTQQPRQQQRSVVPFQIIP
ncbi:MAG: trypsin-like peptidase domain-containing protein [Oscillospiraceae bacterium]|nr:trypsin-like peptidase domain-containing protein [Oscillospiraceae bacterium]